MLTWVASAIGNDLYAGVLRGAKGTLRARTGNSADKALLLHDLVRASAATAELRFASCQLPANQVDDLIESAAAYRPPRARLVAENARELASRSRNGEVRAALDRLAQLWQASAAETRDEASALVKLLDEVNVSLTPAAASKTRLQSVAAHHFWLQRRDEQGTWTDLDPTLAAAAPGKTRCKPDASFPELPADQFGVLTLKAKVEERRDGALRTRDVLERSWRIADLADTSITFTYAEPAGVKVSRPSPALRGARAYTPMIRVRDEYIEGQPIWLPIPATASASPLGSALGRIGSVFSGAEPTPQSRAQAPVPAGPVASEAAASWLEVTMSTADGWRDTLESPLFDRIGYAARRSGQAPAAQLAPLPEADGEYIPLGMMLNVAVWTGAPTAGVARANRAKATAAGEFPQLADGLDRLHRTYYRLRAALFESAQAKSSARVVSLHPGVSVLAAGLVDKTQGPTLVMDLTSDHSQPIAGESSHSAAVAWTVSSIVSERLVVNGSLVVGGQQAPASTDVITVFAAARLAQVPFQILRPGDASKIQAMSVSPQARARIEARLAQGRSLLLPARPPSTAFQTDFGWWEVDLEDGVVRDEMENGRHGQGPEYVATDEPARRSAPWWQRLGCAVVFGTALGIASFEAYEGNPEGAAEGTEVIMTEFDRARRAQEIEEEIDAALKGRCR